MNGMQGHCQGDAAWHREQREGVEMTQKANEKDASQLKRALSQAWKDIETLPIVEIGAGNAGVLEYMQHWEGRATKAESQLDEVTQQRDELIHQFKLLKVALKVGAPEYGYDDWLDMVQTALASVKESK